MDLEVRYVKGAEGHLAYAVVGAGPQDLVVVPGWCSNLEVLLELPSVAAMITRLAEFTRVICFDRRGSGLSEGSGAATLDAQVDDIRAVLAAAGCRRPTLMAAGESTAVAALFAAAFPQEIGRLVLYLALARLTAAEGYEWTTPPEERRERDAQLVARWGTPEAVRYLYPGAPHDAGLSAWGARLQRMAMGPGDARATLDMLAELDVRPALPAIQCPTLVLRREHDEMVDRRHALYAAAHIPHAQLVEVPGDEPMVFVGDTEPLIAEIERFVTGSTPAPRSNRVLATVLMTDLVGSTERAAEVGDTSWSAFLEQHNAVVEQLVSAERGRVVKWLGDGALAMFDGPSRAISAALAIEDELARLGIPARAGLHTGECEQFGGDDLSGIAVHIAARVSAAAGPGEVLVTRTVRDLAYGGDARFAPRGATALKGVPERWELFAVERGG